MCVIAWWLVSSQAMWQRPHWMQFVWSIRALTMQSRFRRYQLVTRGDGAADELVDRGVALPA
jgi:hypothetical protein